jgi:hypothetical protein
MLGIGLGLTQPRGGSATGAVLSLLAAAGRKAFFPSTNPATGWWQDSAGTTQAALEQPVGRITDLSGNGYHATQATSLNRPLYTQRVNSLQRTRAYENAVWGKTAAGTGAVPTATDNAATAPDGSSTASLIVLNRGAGNTLADRSIITQVFTGLGAGISYLGTFWLKAAPGNAGKQVGVRHVAGSGYGVYTLTDDWVQYTRTETSAASQSWAYENRGTITTDNTVSFYTWDTDCRLSAFSAMNLPAYQRVGNGTAGVADYDTAGFRDMLYFDGTSDALATSAIDLTGTDQIMALCNVLKVSDAAQGMVYETTASSAANNGSMFISAPAAASATYSAGSRGTALATATSAASYAAPNLACLRFNADVSSDSVALLRQAASIATSATDQGTGNYSSAALYIGARAGTSLWFKGYMIPGPLLDTTGIPAALLDQMAREQAALWGVAI